MERKFARVHDAYNCELQLQPFHSQEWSTSNFPCSLTRNITSRSMKNLAFHRLLRWEMIILPILPLPPSYISFQKVGRMYFLNLGVKGLNVILLRIISFIILQLFSIFDSPLLFKDLLWRQEVQARISNDRSWCWCHEYVRARDDHPDRGTIGNVQLLRVHLHQRNLLGQNICQNQCLPGIYWGPSVQYRSAKMQL